MILVEVPALGDQQFKNINRVLWQNIPQGLVSSQYVNNTAFFIFVSKEAVPSKLAKYIRADELNMTLYPKVDRDLELVLDRFEIPK